MGTPIPPLAQANIENLLDKAVLAVTDSAGLTDFSLVPEFARSGESVLWASIPGKLAEFQLLERLEGDATKTLVFVLEGATRFEVRVVDSDGAAVADAQVLQVGVSTWEARPMYYSGSVPVAARDLRTTAEAAIGGFCREYWTDSRGRVDVVFPELPTVVWARHDTKTSECFLVLEERARAELCLGAPLEASGTITMSSGGILPRGLVIESTWKAGGPSATLGTISVGDDGRWGPHTLPARKEGTYRFRLSGGGIIVQDKTYPAPAENDAFVVDFSAEAGVGQEVLVKDEQGNPLDNARVEIIWKEQETWSRAIAWSDSDGVAVLEGCKPTTIWLRVSKNGYIENTEGNVSIPRPIEEMVMVLARSSRLSGIVTCEDEPIEDFLVIVWTPETMSSDRHAFANREDGRFEIDTVPTGQVMIMASSDNLPESEVQSVEMQPGGEAEVVIELDAGVQGKGLVVDGLHGDPIPGCTVQLQNCFRSRSFGPRGAPQRVGLDGTFLFHGVSPRESSVMAACPGYVSTYGQGKLGPDGIVDFGILSLSRREALKVVLLGERPRADELIWFYADGLRGEDLPIMRVPPSGVLEIPDVAPGGYTFALRFEDASVQTRRCQLEPGSPWVVELPFEQSHTVTVRLHSHGHDSVPPSDVWATWMGDDGIPTNRAVRILDGDSVTMLNMPTGKVFFAVFAVDGLGVIGAAAHDLQPPTPQTVDLYLTDRGVHIRVVDKNGQPRNRSRAYVASDDPADPWTDHRDVNAEGEMVFRGIALDTVTVCAFEPGGGFTQKTVDLLPNGLTEVELVIDDGDDMLVIATDTSERAPAVKLRSAPACIAYSVVHFGTTDTNGEKTWPNVAHGSYTIHLSRYGYWPATHTVHFEGQSPIHLPIRRRGKLEATITRSGSTPIPGAQLRLHSTEFEASITDWLAAGKLEASAVQLIADAGGRVFAHGIPHGTYSWTATSPDGATSSGQLVVPPGATLETALVVGNQ